MSMHATRFCTYAVTGLTVLTVSPAFGAALDPHQQAREVIVPPAVTVPAPPAGVMGRIIEFEDGSDGHALARQSLRPDVSPDSSTLFRGVANTDPLDAVDTHQRARHTIGNRD